MFHPDDEPEKPSPLSVVLKRLKFRGRVQSSQEEEEATQENEDEAAETSMDNNGSIEGGNAILDEAIIKTRLCRKLTWTMLLRWFSVATLVFSIASLALEDVHLDTRPELLQEVVFYWDLVVVAFLLIEAVARAVARGPKRYFSSTAFFFDAALCGLYITHITMGFLLRFTSAKGDGVFITWKVTTTLRGLIPFKLIQYFDSKCTHTGKSGNTAMTHRLFLPRCAKSGQGSFCQYFIHQQSLSCHRIMVVVLCNHR